MDRPRPKKTLTSVSSGRKKPKSAATVHEDGNEQTDETNNRPATPEAPRQPWDWPEGVDQSFMPSATDMDTIAEFMRSRELVPRDHDDESIRIKETWRSDAQQLIDELCLIIMPLCSCPASQEDDDASTMCKACCACNDLTDLCLSDVAACQKDVKNKRLAELLRVAPVVAKLHSLVTSTDQKDKVRNNIPRSRSIHTTMLSTCTALTIPEFCLV